MTADHLAAYRSLEQELYRIRARYNGEDSCAEEAHLQNMDTAWVQLTDQEQHTLNQERVQPQVLLAREPSGLHLHRDTNVWLRRPSMPPRRIWAPACM